MTKECGLERDQHCLTHRRHILECVDALRESLKDAEAEIDQLLRYASQT